MNIECLLSAGPKVILVMSGESMIQTGLTPKMISTLFLKIKIVIREINGLKVSR